MMLGTIVNPRITIRITGHIECLIQILYIESSSYK